MQYGLALFVGISLHRLLFSRNEWDRHAPAIALFFSLPFPTLLTVLLFGADDSLAHCIKTTCQLELVMFGGLFGSMIVYRAIFHPLRSIPGPITARLTSFWVIKENWPDLRFYVTLQKLHNTYGDFVRIRPREVSICNPDAILDVHGPRSKILKGEFYEQIYPSHSLHFTRDKNRHKYQRRYWDKAFQPKALQEYTPRLTNHYRNLMNVLNTNAASNTPVDASYLFMDLFFDVVSDLMFGQSFDSLTLRERSPITREFVARQKAVGFVIMNMWVFHLIRAIRQLASHVMYWVQWCVSSPRERKELRERHVFRTRQWYIDALEERAKMQEISPDLFTYLSMSDTFDVDGLHEAKLAVVAGADTNAITASNACYLLCQYPGYQKLLYEELASLPTRDGLIDDQYLLDKQCLLSIINETLRLYPPAPGGLQRLTPPEGAVVAGRYIPGDMIVSTPTHALQRDPRAFVQPNEFIPERWTTRPELVLRKEAFVPFSYGAYNCAGKPLAMMQLRMVLAMVIKRFEISFELNKEAECQHYIEDQADCFTLHLHSLPLVFRERGS